MNLLRLSFNLLRRDWRAGEWRVLMLALVLAVGSLSTVGLFADRVRQALVLQAASLLGADLRVSSTRPFSPLYRQMATARGLQVVESRTFPSMVSRPGNLSDGALLCEIQAVEAGYPLRGAIEIKDVGLHVARTIPQPGTLWVDERVMRRYALHAGDKLGVGAALYRGSGYRERGGTRHRFCQFHAACRDESGGCGRDRFIARRQSHQLSADVCR